MTSQNDDSMSPDSSPDSNDSGNGGRRVNNVPIIIILGVILAFLCVMVWTASTKTASSKAAKEEATFHKNASSSYAAQLADGQSDGIVEANMPDMPDMDNKSNSNDSNDVPDESDLKQTAEKNSPQNPPAPQAAPSAPKEDPMVRRMRQAKMQRFQEAAMASSSLPVPKTGSSSSLQHASSSAPSSRSEMLARIQQVQAEMNSSQTDATPAYQDRLQQIKGGSNGRSNGISSNDGRNVGGGNQSGGLLNASASGGSGYSEFDNKNGDRWTLNSEPTKPATPYQLRAGFTIPATMISGINSDLPGQIMAQVSQDVFDTPTGRHVLIPQNSRLVGQYSSDVAYGQERVLVAWQRIIFPDGKAMDIGSMPGADRAGYSGLTDQVNNHYLRLFGNAFLMSGVVAGISISQDSDDDDDESASSAMSESLGQVLGQTAAQIISKNLNISPTLEIRPGYRFQVVVTKDLTFKKPYQSFDY